MVSSVIDEHSFDIPTEIGHCVGESVSRLEKFECTILFREFKLF